MSVETTRLAARSPVLSRLLSRDPLDVAPRLTLILIVPTQSSPLLVVGIASICVAMAFPAIYRSPWLWFTVVAVRGWGQWHHWPGLDNHQVLITYWCLAIGLAFLATRPERVLALSASLLIGLSFAFATLWKATSGEYLDGRFFEYTLLVDPRFDLVGELAGGLSESARVENAAAFSELRAPGGDVTEVTFDSTPRIGTIARALTIGGIVGEALVAIAFLLPRRLRGVPTARLLTLVAFCLTTYLMVPVALFGLALVTMGYAQCRDDYGLRSWFLAAAVGIVAWVPVWNLLDTGL